MQQHLESATRHLDGLILVARFARGLRSQDSVLRTLLRVPDALRLPSPDRVGIEQLQAAFIVTDNDGDGKLDAREVRDAVDSVLACGHLLTLDETKMPSVTFSEFALVATGMLESQEPFVHLSACLDELFVGLTPPGRRSLLRALGLPSPRVCLRSPPAPKSRRYQRRSLVLHFSHRPP